MRIFAGLSHTDYEEVFRAIGALVDERGWRNVTVMEVEEGLVLQVTPPLTYHDSAPRLETYLLTDSDIERIMRQALLQRQREIARVMNEQVARAEPAGAGAPAPAAAPDGSATGDGADAGWRAASGEAPLPDFGEPADLGGFAFDGEAGDAGLAPLPDDFGLEAFAPMPMHADGPDTMVKDGVDLGAARAAIVMANIVAARLRSGAPLTTDDPDLASLLDQVRALDAVGIGQR
ncbi:MAG TPA: hypothetical protein VFL91_23945 [Thermomicrobiales bacterium]|nr:hypothetical protein [Thermomicrobiales bacterium]